VLSASSERQSSPLGLFLLLLLLLHPTTPTAADAVRPQMALVILQPVRYNRRTQDVPVDNRHRNGDVPSANFCRQIQPTRPPPATPC